MSVGVTPGTQTKVCTLTVKRNPALNINYNVFFVVVVVVFRLILNNASSLIQQSAEELNWNACKVTAIPSIVFMSRDMNSVLQRGVITVSGLSASLLR